MYFEDILHDWIKIYLYIFWKYFINLDKNIFINILKRLFIMEQK